MISTRMINSEEEIVSLRERWDELVAEEGLDISNSYEWSMCLLESHLGRKDVPAIVSEDGSRLLGIFPFFVKKKSLNLIPVEVICPIFHLFSVHNDLLIRRDGVEVIASIFNEMGRRKEFGNWRIMEIPGVVAGGRTDQMLRTYLDREGFQYKLLRGASSPFIKIENRSWEGYLSSKNSKIRGNFRRRQKNMEQVGKVEIKLIKDSCEILRILFSIENSSWKYRDGSAITNKNEQMMFYELLIRRLNNQVIFLVLFLDGEPISYTLCILFRNKCYFLKTSYDEKYRKLSPGIVVLLDLLKYCFEKKFSEFDFAGKDEEHKLDFTNEIRNHHSYLIFNKDLYSYFLYKTAQLRDKIGFQLR